jgi:hypothetical protein
MNLRGGAGIFGGSLEQHRSEKIKFQSSILKEGSNSKI